MRGIWKAAWWLGWLLAFCFALVCLLFLSKLASPLWANATAVSGVITIAAAQTQPSIQPCAADAAPKTKAKGISKPVPMAVTNNFISCSGSGTAAPVGSAGGTGDKSAGERPDTNQAIANTMTALSAAIAAITLVLTLGAIWISKKSDDILDYQRSVEQSRADVEKLHAEMLRSRTVQLDVFASLLNAKEALRRYVQSATRTSNAWADYVKLATQLEQLMSTRLDIRKAAFDSLLSYLQDVSDLHLRRSLDVYSRGCYEWLQLNNALPKDGSPSWCLLFAPEEQHALAESAARKAKSKGIDFV